MASFNNEFLALKDIIFFSLPLKNLSIKDFK